MGVLARPHRLQHGESARTGYFARQDTKTPVRVGVISLAVKHGVQCVHRVAVGNAGFPVPHALLAVSTGVSASSTRPCCFRD